MAAVTSDTRLQQLQAWLAGIFGDRNFVVTPASADASFRRYFRVTRGAETWIAMDAPPDRPEENTTPYIEIAQMLNEMGVNAPRILERNVREGFLLNTDLGSSTYLAELQNESSADRLYGDALAALLKIQAQGRRYAARLPPYDEALLRRELALFPDWLCARHLEIEFSAAEMVQLKSVFDALVNAALGQPKVFVHRDYHSRNLMVTDGARYGHNPGVLDFQDAVYGPVTYDLVSLLRDCYIAWPAERVYGWMNQFRSNAAGAGVDVGPDEATFKRWFDWMGVQRHLKAIGIFARLWHRDGKPGYLKDVPRTMNYVQRIAAQYQELKFLADFIDARVAPALSAVNTSSR